MNKTPVQELIEEIQYWKEKAPIGSAFRDCLIILEGSAINKLEKEKEQIKLAFREGEEYYGEITSIDYYNQNYIQINGIEVDAIKSQVTTTSAWTPKTNNL